MRGAADPTDELAEASAQAGVEDAVVADDSAERERLWRFREAHTEALSAAGVPHKMDVGVPLARLAEFADARARGGGAPGPAARPILSAISARATSTSTCSDLEPDDDAVDEAVLRVAAACDGTISAEHGIGVAKARWLELVRSPGELRAMARGQARARPDGLLNPGVMLP